MNHNQTKTVEFYWRPGCGFCMMLERSLSRAGLDLEKHNIWDNPADAATVRQHANGSETVPTVVIGGSALVNPSADAVMTLISETAPDLLPEDWQPRKPRRGNSPVRRLLGR